MIIPDLRDLNREEKQQLLRLLREKAKRQAVDNPVRALRASLFEAQRRFFDDTSRFKAAVTSRRAGKSRELASELLAGACEAPTSWNTYLGLTRQSAKDVMWDTLQSVAREMMLDVRWNESELTGRLRNGSYVDLVGADHKRVVERMRGYKRKKAAVDEAGSFSKLLRTLVEDAIEPSLADFRGQLILAGTPPPVRAGYFFEMTNGGPFNTHHWTLRDNPFMGANIDEWLADLRRQRKWSEDHPTYVREWLGQWCDDPASLVYKFRASRDLFVFPEALPQHSWCTVIGMDLGWHDATAFVVLQYSPKSPVAYVVSAQKFRHWTVSRIAQHIEGLMQCYRPERIVADTGGLGKVICEELAQRYNFPIKAAEKTDKNTAIEMVNTDLADERLKIGNNCAELTSEMQVLQWDENGKEMAGQENHCCDSLIYAHKYCYHYWHQPERKKPEPGSSEYHAALERDMLESVVSQHKAEQENLTDGQLAWPSYI